MSGETYPCPQCQAGLLHLRYLTYFTRLGQAMLTVPNFPAWLCDVCGYLEYDQQALRYLNTMLSPWLQEEDAPRAPNEGEGGPHSHRPRRSSM